MTIASVAALWRYPVKSMMGEELGSTRLSEHGLIGDRSYALIDRATGKIASAKNPRKWPDMFKFSAALATGPGSRIRLGGPRGSRSWFRGRGAAPRAALDGCAATRIMSAIDCRMAIPQPAVRCRFLFDGAFYPLESR